MNPAEPPVPTVTELRQALAQRQFGLHYQYIVELHGNHVLVEAAPESELSCGQYASYGMLSRRQSS